MWTDAMTLRALVIDDDPIHNAVSQAILEDRGFAVTIAADTRALGNVSLDADIVLLDLNMPEFDGVEYLDVLRQRNFKGGLIIVSGSVASVRRAAETLADAYGLLLLGMVEKPFTVAKLDAVLLPLGELQLTGG
jgi:CheY-like chemotaxis protein